MRYARMHYLLFPLFALFGSKLAAEEAPGARLAKQLADKLPQILAETEVPGLSFALIENGAITYEGGFGVKNAETGEKVTKDTVFEAASLSKPLFAFHVFELSREGKLDLDRPLSEYLDKPWIEGDARLVKITARRVLAHQSGFPNWRPGRWTKNPKPLEIEFEPGSRFGYSGEGYMYLQAVVEKITGRPLAEEMEATLHQRLGMSASSYVWRPDYEKSAAIGHDRKKAVQEKFKPQEALAAGSLHTTAGDYARFLLAVLSDKNAELTTKLLEETSQVEAGLAWSPGWGLEKASPQIPGSPIFWHWGDNGSFKNLTFLSLSEKKAIVCFTNSEAGLKACRPLIEVTFPGRHPALEYHKLDY